MASYENFYLGADMGLDPDYGKYTGFRAEASELGFPTDPFTANQLDAVFKKLSTGAKTIEVSGITPATFESVPEHHLEEINRLRKLAGVELTFHGPLLEPTGISRQGWDETQRQQVERQMWSAVERSHKMDPKGNMVVTFHSSNGLPDPEVRTINEETGEEEITQVGLVDEKTGRFDFVGPPQKDYFKGKPVDIYDQVKEQNKDAWFKRLESVSFHAHNGEGAIKQALQSIPREGKDQKESKKVLLNFYKKFIKEPEKAQQDLKNLGDYAPWIQQNVSDITHGDLYLRDAYQDLQTLFNQAYDVALKSENKNDLAKLDKFQKQIAPKIKYIEDPEKVEELSNAITRGVNVLRTISPPQTLKPMKEFAIDKAADTFSNLAFRSYKKFKSTAPIISIENPPAGSGLARADEMRDLVKAAQEKFTKRAQKELGLSESQAEKQAKKLIGVTWDVGHINMIRKFGYDEKDIIKETKKVAPHIKHVHLSDNFGLEHTELPMGMGNVPTKKHLELIEKYNKRVKKIAETGNWFNRQGQGLGIAYTPIRETFEAFGSPVSAVGAAPYWNQQAGMMGDYFAGRGMNPEQHHNLYGAGFANLPVELGGQMAGQNRLSGAPVE